MIVRNDLTYTRHGFVEVTNELTKQKSRQPASKTYPYPTVLLHDENARTKARVPPGRDVEIPDALRDHAVKSGLTIVKDVAPAPVIDAKPTKSGDKLDRKG